MWNGAEVVQDLFDVKVCATRRQCAVEAKPAYGRGRCHGAQGDLAAELGPAGDGRTNLEHRRRANDAQDVGGLLTQREPREITGGDVTQ